VQSARFSLDLVIQELLLRTRIVGVCSVTVEELSRTGFVVRQGFPSEAGRL